MSPSIKEIRNAAGLSQTEFAKVYQIPVSTLRKWEQGEASPAPYVIRLLANAVPGCRTSLEIIPDRDGTKYYYDSARQVFLDDLGNAVGVTEPLEGVNRKNLAIYLREFFEDYYRLQEKLNRDLRFDIKENIQWV